MNPLTQIKNTQKVTRQEIELGLFEKASWHDRYKHSAYVFVGGLDYGLTEGDLLAVFAQYGELVDVHLARDKATGKSKGFAFLAYEDQRSTVLAVDNLNGATVVGRKIRVEHVDNYRKRKAELEGEDPDAPEAKRQATGDASGGPVPAAGGSSRQPQEPTKQQPVVAAGGGGGAALGSGRMTDAWSAPDSLFSLLTDGGGDDGAPAAAAAAAAGRDKKAHKEHKNKKEKHSKKDKKHKERDRGRSRSRSRSPARRNGAAGAPAGFGPPRPPTSAAAGGNGPGSFGPPRPPAQQHIADRGVLERGRPSSSDDRRPSERSREPHGYGDRGDDSRQDDERRGGAGSSRDGGGSGSGRGSSRRSSRSRSRERGLRR